eukprot:2689689-Rhodomonas_salina.1
MWRWLRCSGTSCCPTRSRPAPPYAGTPSRQPPASRQQAAERGGRARQWGRRGRRGRVNGNLALLSLDWVGWAQRERVSQPVKTDARCVTGRRCDVHAASVAESTCSGRCDVHAASVAESTCS